MEKTILITGAALRIGRELALGLSKHGWRIAVHYNNSQNDADKLVQEIIDQGGQTTSCRAISVQANLMNDKSSKTLIEQAVDRLQSPLTALINNASIFEPDTADNFTTSLFDTQMQINLKAPVNLSKHFAAQLPKQIKGNIINIIDQAVYGIDTDFFSYSLSKSALYKATKIMAKTYAPHIRVNAIGPGPTLKNIHQSQADFEQEVLKTPLKTGSPTSSILHACQYLLDANCVTGIMIPVDGGQHLKG